MGYDYSYSIARVREAEQGARAAGVCAHGSLSGGTVADPGVHCACGARWASWDEAMAARSEVLAEYL